MPLTEVEALPDVPDFYLQAHLYASLDPEVPFLPEVVLNSYTSILLRLVFEFRSGKPETPLREALQFNTNHLLSLLELHAVRILEAPFEKEDLFRHLCRGIKEILLAYLINYAEIAPWDWVMEDLLGFLETAKGRIRLLTYEHPLYDPNAPRVVATNYIPPLFTQLFNGIFNRLDCSPQKEDFQVKWRLADLRMAYVQQLDNTSNLNLLKKDLHIADRLQLILLEASPKIISKLFINEVINLLKSKIEAFKRCQGRLCPAGLARLPGDAHKLTSDMTHMIVHLVSLLIGLKTFMTNCETQFHSAYESDLQASLMIDLSDKTLRDTLGRKRFYKGRETFVRSFFRVRDHRIPVIRWYDEFSHFRGSEFGSVPDFGPRVLNLKRKWENSYLILQELYVGLPIPKSRFRSFVLGPQSPAFFDFKDKKLPRALRPASLKLLGLKSTKTLNATENSCLFIKRLWSSKRANTRIERKHPLMPGPAAVVPLLDFSDPAAEPPCAGDNQPPGDQGLLEDPTSPMKVNPNFKPLKSERPPCFPIPQVIQVSENQTCRLSESAALRPPADTVEFLRAFARLLRMVATMEDLLAHAGVDPLRINREFEADHIFEKWKALRCPAFTRIERQERGSKLGRFALLGGPVGGP